MSTASTAHVVWHDVECGAYSDDLAAWEELAAKHGGPILELGAGTGRVALHLARREFEVRAVELDAQLASVLRSRADRERLPIEVEVGDARVADRSGGPYPLVIGAMQLLQLVGGAPGRAAVLARTAAALAPRGIAAFAIVEGSDGIVGEADGGVLPDVRELDGWVHSSLPLDVKRSGGLLEVRRLRQSVSPEGELTELEHADRLDVTDAATIEAEAAALGLAAAGRRAVSESVMHVASTIVLLRREG